MGDSQSKRKAGRPSAVGIARKAQVSCPVTIDEREYIRAAATDAGVQFTAFIRDAMLSVAEAHFQSQNNSAKSLKKPAKTNFQVGNGTISKSEIAATDPQKPQQDHLALEKARTRADTRSGARTQKEERELEDPEVGSSLRSDQAAPAEPEVPEPETEDPTDDDPWKQPAPLKQTFKLTTGEVVTNMWLFANACRMPGPDVIRLLESSSYKPLRKAMLRCFARSLRDTYKLRWCSAYNRRTSGWKDTHRSDMALLQAAEYLAIEYAGRGMTTNQFIDACDEMRPKSVRFVPVDMLAGAIGARVAAWVPPEQRERDKPWASHVDTSGTQWVTPAGESPVIVLRTAADRERFLRAAKVR